MFTDSHCHLFNEYYDDILEVIDNAHMKGIDRLIVSGCDQKSNEEIIHSLKKYDNFYGCLGIHPEEGKIDEDELRFIEEHIKDNKIIAIGEIGLDYYYSDINKDVQKELFIRQMEIASKYNMPVVIHSREATLDTIEILKMFPQVKGVIHSFSLSLEVANIYRKLGYKLGINGVVTFKNCHLKEILPDILPDIILETDSPYLTPHPYRGKRNEPKYIYNIAQFICDEVGIELEELSKITNQNIRNIFNI